MHPCSISLSPLKKVVSTALLLSAPLLAGAASPGTFFDAVEQYGADNFAGCTRTLDTLYNSGGAFPAGGELLLVECAAASGDRAAALAYIDALLPTGRLPLDDLRTKTRPGLDALRADPVWPSVLQRIAAEEHRHAAQRDDPLRDALLQREAKDQAAQHAAVAAGGGSAWAQTTPVSVENATWLKATVAEKGWPERSRVGADGAKAAWVIVQHADHDPAFQAEMLPLIENAARRGEADLADYALLTDRVLLAQGKPQRYGSQFKENADGIFELQPTADMDGLDARRREVGLQPLAAYKAVLAEMYGKQVR
ncbi:DUF6624 domain-containing protein [Stenotrophomonas sp. NPDC077421]|uniref:DUF6624 domain-containing protein n=1 Tax=Stenotrophomonas sp. NPDC077421 TaxID=3414699 RepID=UPI003C2E6EE8